MATAARAMATAMRVSGEQQQGGGLRQGLRVNKGDKGGGNGNGDNVGNGNGEEAGGKQRGKE